MVDVHRSTFLLKFLYRLEYYFRNDDSGGGGRWGWAAGVVGVL